MLLIRFFFTLILSLTPLYAQAPSGDQYSGDENVFELNASNFDKVVHHSNYTSIVKFYAPWCGYCQKLKPIYSRLGKFFNKDAQYAIHVGAVNCDKASNKQLCSEHRINGFPTLMVFRPPKYSPGSNGGSRRHAIETYNGERTLKAIDSFVTSRVKNYVKSFQGLDGDKYQKFLDEPNSGKVLLLTAKQLVSVLYKSLAIDFLGSISFGAMLGKYLSGELLIDGKLQKVNPKDLPLLLIYKDNEGFISYQNREKLNNKTDISKWLMEKTGEVPHEGHLSKKDQKYYSKYRSGKKAAKKQYVNDEL